MTRVDFYIAPESAVAAADRKQDWLTLACRVVEKAWQNRHDVYVHTDDDAAMAALDDLLWSFRPNSFIPHRSEHEPGAGRGDCDILVGCSGAPDDHHDVLVNLTDSTPEFFSRFTRIAEIVPGDATARQRSRERYKYYRERGYPLHVHNL